MVRKRDTVIKLNLRLPKELHRRLERAAKTENKSLNTEILHRLEQSFQNEEVNTHLLFQLAIDLCRAVRMVDWQKIEEAALRAGVPDDGEEK